MRKASKHVGKGRRANFNIEDLKPATDNQRKAIEAFQNSQAVILEGLAGTGKTYLAIHHAAQALSKGLIDKVILTRPLTTVGNEKLGFLPGDVAEKVSPFTEQFHEYLSEFAPMLQFEDRKMIEEKIEFIPMAYLRGRNFRKVVIIADEMQNSSIIQMKTLLTRMTEEAQLIILGDTKQEDRKQVETNGLSDLLYKISTAPKQDFFGHVHFGRDDIQRGALVKFVMELYGDV